LSIKGYAPPSSGRSVEGRLLGDIVTQDGVTGAVLLDAEGFVLFSQPLHDDSVQMLGKAIALLDPQFATGRVTLNAENATLIAQHLLGNRVLVVRCEVSSNLGHIRHVLDSAANQFNALIP
jgi:predicted regulator of Ras-like GTPase activity (Roadblock/LC7/MglB family)